MIQRRMTLEHPIGLHDVRRVIENIKNIGEGEELVIQMSNLDSFRAEGIFSILDKENYQWTTKGGHDGIDYYIVARRR
ncbi:MAG TPA: hypothetical protein GX498_09180 [Clostridiales bacterium]|nr:hypothetical protein [Clostridiales bacterium]